MRILIATGIFKPEVGGPATLALELAKRLQTTGHKVTVVTYSDKEHFDFDPELPFHLVRIVRKGNKISNYINYFKTVRRLMPKQDIIYTLDWFSAGVPLMLASIITGKKYIVRVGGGYIWEKYLAEGNEPVTLKQFYEKGLHKRYRLMYELIKRVFKRAQYVVFNSDIQRALYEKYYGLSHEKTQTIYNAIPENRLSGLVQNYNMNFAERDHEIVFAGRFIKMKNVESLVKAFAKMSDKSFKLVLIGDGPTSPVLHNLVNELGIKDRVEFIPTLSQSDLYKRIAHCYVAVIPSWTDVSPHQAYECLALGIPVLVTKENYLSIASSFKTTIDPTSVDQITKTLDTLALEKEYETFITDQKKITFDHSWLRVLEEHIHLFMKSLKH